MNSVKELRRLLLPSLRVQTGEVLVSTADSLTIKTGNGIQVLKNNGSLYANGASVLVKDSIVLGLVKSEDKLPQYWL